MGDLTFFAQPRAAESICQGLADSNADVPWWCQTRADYLTLDRAQRLHEAGCVQVAIGIETAGSAGLNGIDKGTTTKQCLAACGAAKDAGLSVQGYFVLGVPGETVESAQATITLMKQLLDDGLVDATHLAIVTPYPGTSLFNTPTTGLQIVSREWSCYWMNCDPFGADIPVVSTPTLSPLVLYALWLQMLAAATEHYNALPPVHCYTW
jgi:radical SAM superfamily enzyme YgiQ (UPF0313 family)